MSKCVCPLLIVLFCLILPPLFAQKGLTKGEVLQSTSIKKLLNSPSSITSINDFQKSLTIIDFFGTWCAPCLRALPHLGKVKQRFKDELDVVLVSNETEVQLTKFIKARKEFLFPVIVDDDNKLNNLFQPPSLPYTVVIDKGGKIVAITKAEEISDTLIQQLLFNSPKTIVNNSNVEKGRTGIYKTVNQKSVNSFVQLSQDYIYSAKTGDSVAALSLQLKQLNLSSLTEALSTNDAKKAFWINIYNGFTQATLKTNPDRYQNRNAFFGKKQVEIAGHKFSLDDIEHGILRRSKIKWSFGHINKFFPSKVEKALRVAKVDYRIHFALNCGAKSCPPIAFYNPDHLDRQLDVATDAYLSGEVDYDSSSNVLYLPKLMSWFRADFGGKKGMMEIVKSIHLVPGGAQPKIKFKDYDWTITLNNYKNYE
jgi:thiol-disulfide isomerase/thioredoxin